MDTLPARGRLFSLLLDLDQLDVEDEHTLRPVRLPVVGELAGNPEAAGLAFHHELDAFAPAGDDPVEGKGDRSAADDRGVEHLAVSRPAGVVDLDRVGERRMD